MITQRHRQKGFTISELMVALSIVGILSTIAFPNVKAMRDQLRVSEDARSIGLILGELRGESIRLKRSIRIIFTSTGISWDYYNDGIIDGSYRLQTGITWSSLPTNVIFNGFGLLRGVSIDQNLRLQASTTLKQTIIINKNGHITL